MKQKKESEETKLNPPMTNEEWKALLFYRMTKCNWGGNSDEMDGGKISDEEYIEHLRKVEKEKEYMRQNEKT